jgi:hypothetical protein
LFVLAVTLEMNQRENNCLAFLNSFIETHNINQKELKSIYEVPPYLFNVLFDGICQVQLSSVLPNYETLSASQNLNNLSLIIDYLSSTVIKMSLDHIPAAKVIEKDKETLLNLTEIFQVLASQKEAPPKPKPSKYNYAGVVVKKNVESSSKKQPVNNKPDSSKVSSRPGTSKSITLKPNTFKIRARPENSVASNSVASKSVASNSVASNSVAAKSLAAKSLAAKSVNSKNIPSKTAALKGQTQSDQTKSVKFNDKDRVNIITPDPTLNSPTPPFSSFLTDSSKDDSLFNETISSEPLTMTSDAIDFEDNKDSSKKSETSSDKLFNSLMSTQDQSVMNDLKQLYEINNYNLDDFVEESYDLDVKIDKKKGKEQAVKMSTKSPRTAAMKTRFMMLQKQKKHIQTKKPLTLSSLYKDPFNKKKRPIEFDAKRILKELNQRSKENNAEEKSSAEAGENNQDESKARAFLQSFLDKKLPGVTVPKYLENLARKEAILRVRFAQQEKRRKDVQERVR